VVVEKALSWNDHKIGFVIGANHTDELKKVTKKYEETPILIPGVGAQKNSLEKTINSLQHGLFVINQSRSIIYSAPRAQDEAEFMQIVGENAKNARDEINRLVEAKTQKK
jgi:orotidine-5'-phosphate decarboxylase